MSRPIVFGVGFAVALLQCLLATYKHDISYAFAFFYLAFVLFLAWLSAYDDTREAQ